MVSNVELEKNYVRKHSPVLSKGMNTTTNSLMILGLFRVMNPEPVRQELQMLSTHLRRFVTAVAA